MSTLILGPIGARPWLTVDELVESLRALGHDVVVNGAPEDVLPMPPAWRPTATRAAGHWLRWRRRARRSLADAGVKRILVWDPVVALLARAARPRGVEIIWVPSPASQRRRDRVVHRAVQRLVDRVVMTPPALPPSDRTLVEKCVVFGTGAPVTDAALDALREHAPIDALVFDARAHETISDTGLARLVDTAQPRFVWWCGDDEWMDRLGGVPARVLDPSPTFVADHRHLSALGAGASLMRIVGSDWTQVARTEIGDALHDEGEWATVVLGGHGR